MSNTNPSKNTALFKVIFWFTIACGALLTTVMAYRYNTSTNNVIKLGDFLKIIPDAILPYIILPIMIVLALIENSKNLKEFGNFQLKTSYLILSVIFGSIVLIGTLTISSFLLNPTVNIIQYLHESIIISVVWSSIIPFTLSFNLDYHAKMPLAIVSPLLSTIVCTFYFFQHTSWTTDKNDNLMFHYVNVTSSISGWILIITIAISIILGALLLVMLIVYLISGPDEEDNNADN